MTTPTMLFSGPAWYIRPATDADAGALLDVYRACEDFLALGPVPVASAEMVAKDRALSQEAGGVFCAVCTEAGALCGVLDFIPRYEGRPEVAFLELLMLAQPYRNRGWGARIVAALKQYVAASGTRRLLAGVQANNPAAQRFWLRQGFSITAGPKMLPDQTICYDLACEL